MQKALDQAFISFNKDEIPVGCAIWLDNEIISLGRNKSMELGPTRHAEIEALEKAYKVSKNLRSAIIFVTMEPCVMCFAAIKKSGIKNIYFSTYNDKEGFSNYLDSGDIFYQSGILEKESKELLRNFFEGKR